MAQEIRFLIEKKPDGSLSGYNNLIQELQSLPEGKWTLVLRRFRKSRSGQQNSYYHACVIPCIIDGLVEAGYNRSDLSRDIVHEMLKAKFLTRDLPNDNGEFIPIIKSTTDLTTTEFMEYISDIQQWAQEFLNIYVPEPNEQAKFNY